MPDVSVIVPVYNTMPYLTACLESLVGQTLAADRFEIIAVDDGSTDGSGQQIDRYAAEHPDLIRVVHQPNSGGPASPCNRGLELATGKYVFFVGGDDYLGAEALERLVKVADEWESDVVLAKIVSAGTRSVESKMYLEQVESLDLFDSRLPYAMGNTKLFRRSLIDEHDLRFPEDLPMGSDQPFTFSALLHSRRTSVVNDYAYYYGVRREDSSNITFSATGRLRIDFTAKMMDFVASKVEAGPRRDAILIRHFDWEVNETLQLGFVESPDEDQQAVCQIVARLVDDYLTEPVSARLAVAKRVRIRLAAAGRTDVLVQAIRDELGDERRRPSYVVDGNRLFLDFAGFGDALPDDAYELHARELSAAMEKRVELTASDVRGSIHIEATAPVVTRGATLRLEVVDAQGNALAASPLSQWPEHRATTFDLTVPKADGLALRIPLADATVDLAIPGTAKRSVAARAGAAIRRRMREFDRA